MAYYVAVAPRPGARSVEIARARAAHEFSLESMRARAALVLAACKTLAKH